MKGFKYCRKHLAEEILRSPQTKDGIFWISDDTKNRIKEESWKLNSIIDSKYVVNRFHFYSKKFYTFNDISLFLCNDTHVDLLDYDYFNEKFNKDNEDILTKRLDDKLNDISVRDIIDIYLRMKSYYNIFL